MKIISQRQAAARGMARFYTGRPCRRGHDAERYVAGGNCVECHREDKRAKDAEVRRLQRAARGSQSDDTVTPS